MANSVTLVRIHILRCLIWVYTVCKGLSVTILRLIMVIDTLQLRHLCQNFLLKRGLLLKERLLPGGANSSILEQTPFQKGICVQLSKQNVTTVKQTECHKVKQTECHKSCLPCRKAENLLSIPLYPVSENIG